MSKSTNHFTFRYDMKEYFLDKFDMNVSESLTAKDVSVATMTTTMQNLSSRTNVTEPSLTERMKAKKRTTDTESLIKPWIRGVNLGGWLVMERYITPYQFAITDCHLRGEHCWYPGSASAPKNFTDRDVCNLHKCHPSRTTLVRDNFDYPVDEWTLGKAFLDAQNVGESPDGNDLPLTRPASGVAIAEDWFNYHFENFITEADIAALEAAGVTHVRVPIPHFILGHVRPDEAWIIGSRWQYFIRMCHIARIHNIQVWPDIHTAPGSQNGFDNSGQQNNYWATCTGWSDNPENIQRTLDAIDAITQQIASEGLHNDVVTGFGLLNEPFKDCNRQLYEEFLETGKRIVRTNLGEKTSIYVSDMFLASTFNDGKWWLDKFHDVEKKDPNIAGQMTPYRVWSQSYSTVGNESILTPIDLKLSNPYHDTYLDSHYYQVFDATTRKLSPAQHIAFACQQQYKDSVSCCYERDYSVWSFLTGRYGQEKAIPEQGVRRIVGEWSAAYDTLPGDKLRDMMQSIAESGLVIEYDRQLSLSERQFLINYVQAQMVVYESQQVGVSTGWFYWTAKMEGGAFAEWDFLRGIAENWIPIIPPPDISSESLYGSCYDILLRTNDTEDAIADVIHTFPDPFSLPSDTGSVLDDDVIASHGKSLIDKKGHYPLYPPSPLIHNRGVFGLTKNQSYYYGPSYHIIEWVIAGIAVCLLFFVFRFTYLNMQYCHGYSKKGDMKTLQFNNNKRFDYTPISSEATIKSPTCNKQNNCGLEIDC